MTRAVVSGVASAILAWRAAHFSLVSSSRRGAWTRRMTTTTCWMSRAASPNA